MNETCIQSAGWPWSKRGRGVEGVGDRQTDSSDLDDTTAIPTRLHIPSDLDSRRSSGLQMYYRSSKIECASAQTWLIPWRRGGQGGSPGWTQCRVLILMKVRGWDEGMPLGCIASPMLRQAHLSSSCLEN